MKYRIISLIMHIFIIILAILELKLADPYDIDIRLKRDLIFIFPIYLYLLVFEPYYLVPDDRNLCYSYVFTASFLAIIVFYDLIIADRL